MKYTRAKRVAKSIIDGLSIEHPSQIKLELIAVIRGVFPKVTRFHGSEARLLMSAKRDCGIASINSNIREEGRRRFALAHELGHFELHKSQAANWNCTENDLLAFDGPATIEPEANAFAAELLMPEVMFHRACIGIAPGFEQVSRLAEMFETSLSATAYRYVEVGTYPCALICSKEGKIVWFSSSSDFKHRIHEIGTPVNENSSAGEFYTTGSCETVEPERTGPSYWLENQESDPVDILYEQSITMRNYGTALTMIWEP